MARATTLCGFGGVRWVDVVVRLVLDRLSVLVWLLDLSVAFCCDWKYGLVRSYTPSLLYVSACIFVVPLRFAESGASYISVASTRP